MTTWTVLKYDDSADDNRWVEKGEFETEASYYLGYDAAALIGERFGIGEFLLLTEDGKRYERIMIAARQSFFEVESDEEPAATGTAVETPA